MPFLLHEQFAIPQLPAVSCPLKTEQTVVSHVTALLPRGTHQFAQRRRSPRSASDLHRAICSAQASKCSLSALSFERCLIAQGTSAKPCSRLKGSFSPVPSNRRSLNDTASRQLPIQLYLTTMTTYALGGRPVTQYRFRTVKTVTSVESPCTHNFLVLGGGEFRGWTI